MRRAIGRFKNDVSGAVAPTVALSLVGLIAAGGIAFDYARLASLDTELQQAADQAALAAATQLDGQDDACARAAAAARDLLKNKTLFANDGDGTDVTVPAESACDATGNVRFYKTYDEENDQPGEAAASDEEAKFVEITVDSRTANYALTPIVAAFSAEADASAVATLGSGAICKVPPLMICNPNEGNGDTFPTAADVGKGLKLEAGGGQTWAPGNYGYLNFGNGSLEEAMGKNLETEPCVDKDAVTTKPGNTASAPAGINTRFDIYQNGLVAACDRATGACSPALNVTKDVVHPQFANPDTGLAPTNANCGYQTGSDPWEQPSEGKRYVPGGPTPASMGLPRDICHAGTKAGSCTNGRFGDGNWNRALYFQINHGTTANPSGSIALAAAATWAGKSSTATTGATALTRYDVYKWEIANWAASPGLARRRQAEVRQKLNPQGKPTGQSTTFYSYTNARCAAGQGATETIKDRRVLTAALVNCTAGDVKGSTHVEPVGWVDLFLVEPSLNRRDNANADLTGADQIYVEVSGVGTKPNGSSDTFQYFLRQRPRLVK